MKAPFSEFQALLVRTQETHTSTFLQKQVFKKGLEQKSYDSQIKGFETEIREVCSAVERFEFFDYFKKNANPKALEGEFEKLKGNFKVLGESNEPYEECLCRNK